MNKTIAKCTNAQRNIFLLLRQECISFFYVQFPLRLPNIDPPKEFSSDYIGDPKITYIDVQGSPSVPLICKAQLFHGIGTWANVTYLVQWFANGAPLWHDERCPGGGASCPREDYIKFKIEGDMYKIGQTVSKQVSKLLSVEMAVVTNDYIIEDNHRNTLLSSAINPFVGVSCTGSKIELICI